MKIPFLLFLTPSLPFSSTTSPSNGFAKITTTATSSSSFSPLDKRCFQLSERINGEPREIRKEGQTGWNHNLPKKDSPFWGNSESNDENTNDSSSSAPLRTGWLHNTESPSEKEAQQKSQQSSTPTNKARQTLELAMKQQRRQHQIVQPPTFHATNDAKLVMVTEHSLRVPLDYSESNNKKDSMRVAFTIVETIADSQDFQFLLEEINPSKRADSYVRNAAMKDADQMLLYLQGGPGFGAPTPVVSLSLSSTGSWLGAALSKYNRIVLMDQRGTGKSSPVTKQSLELLFPEYFDDKDSATPEHTLAKVTDYLTQFRADHIVRDAEEIRDALLLPTADESTPRPWGASLGQSYGGFCTLTYLSQITHPPRLCLLTGGIPPALTATDEVYASLWQRVRQRSLLYYDMYPGDVSLVKQLVRALLAKPVPLPSGGVLTARRLLQLGLSLGGSPSAFASLHALLQSAVVAMPSNDDDSIIWNRAFLKRVEVEQSFDDHPIYYWLHESIYADGQRATRWSAHRQYEELKAAEPDVWDYQRTCRENSVNPVLFFGEMVFPWMSEDYGELQGMGLVAEALAQKADWKPLYNMDRVKQVLTSTQQTRLAASVYYDDMYVDFKACEIMLQGPLSRGKAWITNEYQHSGLRDDGATMFNKLYGMAKGTIRTPS
jgi:pimeloyl-ACP methyl ester carboxylesterase